MKAIRFTPDMQPHLSRVDFGSTAQARDLADWLSGPRSLSSMESRGTAVWLFRKDDDTLIGFGSVGTTEWRWPTQNDPPETMSIIPALAVCVEFQSQREVPEGDTYAMRILKFVVQKAIGLGTPRVVLNVAKGNVPAIKLYERIGFVLLPDSYKGNRKMVLDISQRPNQ